MVIEQIVNSVFFSNTWVLKHESTNQAWLIDCGDFAQIKLSLGEKYDLKAVFLTHSHFDHIYGLNRVLESWPSCRIYTNNFGLEALQSDRLNFSKYHNVSFIISSILNVNIIDSNTDIELYNNINLQCIYTPGHDPSCFCYKLNDCLFTGDSYIPGLKTVTNLRGGNKEQQIQSVKFIEDTLQSCTKILPGHTNMKVYQRNY